MNRQLLLFIISILMVGCFKKQSTFGEKEKIDALGAPVRLEYYLHLPPNAFQYADTPAFVIQQEQELATAVKEIKQAGDPEPWKGAGWDRIKLVFPDTAVNIYTNKFRIGLSASGTFYDLPKENFITRELIR